MPVTALALSARGPFGLRPVKTKKNLFSSHMSRAKQWKKGKRKKTKISTFSAYTYLPKFVFLVFLLLLFYEPFPNVKTLCVMVCAILHISGNVFEILSISDSLNDLNKRGSKGN